MNEKEIKEEHVRQIMDKYIIERFPAIIGERYPGDHDGIEEQVQFAFFQSHQFRQGQFFILKKRKPRGKECKDERESQRRERLYKVLWPADEDENPDDKKRKGHDTGAEGV